MIVEELLRAGCEELRRDIEQRGLWCLECQATNAMIAACVVCMSAPDGEDLLRFLGYEDPLSQFDCQGDTGDRADVLRRIEARLLESPARGT